MPVTSLIGRLPGRIVKRMLNLEARLQRRVSKQINSDLTLFRPNSAGSREAITAITIAAAQQTIPLLVELAGRNTIIVRIEDFVGNAPFAEELKKLFDSYGSDKSSVHNYHLLYAGVLPERVRPWKILEIGLGTNNQDVVSNMGESGRPGASLRAFRDFFPHAAIYGADLDRRILFEEDRIKTFYVDQTDAFSLSELSNQLRDVTFDLIIDDGLHATHANLNTLMFALPKLKPGGWFVVEDIPARTLPVWQLAAVLLKQKCSLISSRVGYVFAVQNIPADCC